MVDSISNWSGGSLLKSQVQQQQANNLAQTRAAALPPTQNAAKAAKSFFETITQSFDQPQRASVKPTAVATTTLTDATPVNSNLPRGSLIDILA